MFFWTSLLTSGQVGPKSSPAAAPLHFDSPCPKKIEMEERSMVKINLRNFYPFCNNDIFLDIPDEVATVLLEAERQEEAYRRRMYRHKAHYSLDRGDGIEHDICFVSLSPSEIYERKITAQQLHNAISALPDKQGKRIYTHYVLGISKSEIARAEGVSEKNIRKSINQGLRNMEIFLRNISE